MDFIKYRIEKALEKTKAKDINPPAGEFLKTRAMQEGVHFCRPLPLV